MAPAEAYTKLERALFEIEQNLIPARKPRKDWDPRRDEITERRDEFRKAVKDFWIRPFNPHERVWWLTNEKLFWEGADRDRAKVVENLDRHLSVYRGFAEAAVLFDKMYPLRYA